MQLGMDIATSKKSVKDISAAFLAEGKALGVVTLKARAAELGMKALRIAGNMAIGYGIGLVLNFALEQMDNYIHRQEKAAAAAANLKSEYNSLNSEVISLGDEIKTASARIDELLSKGSLSIVEQEELTRLQLANVQLERQIRLKKQLSESTGKESEKAAIKAYTYDKKTSLSQPEQYQGDGESVKNVTAIESANEYIAKIKELRKQQDSLNKKFDHGAITSKDYNIAIEANTAKQDSYSEKLGKTVAGLEEIDDQLIGSTKEGNALKGEIKDVVDAYLSLSDDIRSKNFTRIFDSADFKDVKDELNDLAQQGTLTAETLADPKYADFMKLMALIGVSAEEAANQINAAFARTSEAPIAKVKIKSLEDSLKLLKETQSAYQALSTTVEAYNNTAGYLSIETLESVVSLGHEYLQCLTMENGQLKLNQKELLKLAYARIDDAEASYLQEATGLLKTFQDQKVAADSLKDSLSKLSGERLKDAEAAYKEAFASAIKAGGDTARAARELDTTVNNIGKTFDEARGSLGKYGTAVLQAGKDTTKAADDMKKAYTSANSAINSLLKMTMEMVKQNYATEKEELETLKKEEKERYDASKKALEDNFEETKRQYELEKDAIDYATNAAKNELDLKLKALQAEKDAYDWKKKLDKQNKNVSDLEADLATLKNDDSDESLAKQREIEAKIAEEKENLQDIQFDHSQELAKNSLNHEYDLFEETQKNKLDILEKAEKSAEAAHKAELDNLEERYNAFIKIQDAKIKNIDDYTKRECNIRAEAIKLIEDKNSGLYQKLLEWNQKYGDGINANVKVAWDNAQASLLKFNEIGQVSVLSTLNMLAEKMNDFSLNIKDAVSYAKDLNYELAHASTTDPKAATRSKLNEELRKAYKEQQMAGDGNDVQSKIDDLLYQIEHLENHHSGVYSGFVGNLPPPTNTSEAFAKLMKGELVINPPQMDNFMTNIMPKIGIGNTTSVINNEKFMSRGDVKIKQGDIIIQGNADKTVVSDIRKITADVTEQLMSQIRRGGIGNLKVL